jgi:hypothetical protein
MFILKRKGESLLEEPKRKKVEPQEQLQKVLLLFFNMNYKSLNTNQDDEWNPTEADVDQFLLLMKEISLDPWTQFTKKLSSASAPPNHRV